MLTGRVTKSESGKIACILETDSLVTMAEAIHAAALREKLSALIAAVDLERARFEREEEVNEALEAASALLLAIDSGGLGNGDR